MKITLGAATRLVNWLTVFAAVGWLAFAVVRHNREINQQNQLIRALCGQDTSAVRTLLSAGVAPDLPAYPNTKPVVRAVRCRNAAAVALLFEYGLRPGSTSAVDSLREAVLLNNAPMVRLLLTRGVNPDQKGSWGRSARQAARDAGHKELALLFERRQPK